MKQISNKFLADKPFFLENFQIFQNDLFKKRSVTGFFLYGILCFCYGFFYTGFFVLGNLQVHIRGVFRIMLNI